MLISEIKKLWTETEELRDPRDLEENIPGNAIWNHFPNGIPGIISTREKFVIGIGY